MGKVMSAKGALASMMQFLTSLLLGFVLFVAGTMFQVFADSGSSWPTYYLGGVCWSSLPVVIFYGIFASAWPPSKPWTTPRIAAMFLLWLALGSVILILLEHSSSLSPSSVSGILLGPFSLFWPLAFVAIFPSALWLIDFRKKRKAEANDTI